MAFERRGFARCGQQPECVGSTGGQRHGENLDDLGRRAGEHGDARLAGAQRGDVVGGHALEKIGAVGVGEDEHARGRAQLQRRSVPQGSVFL